MIRGVMMKNVKGLIVGAVILVLIAGVFLLFKFGVIFQSGLGGYQVMSVSQASIVNDGTLGKAWLVTVSTIPSSFAITGRVLASDVAQKVGQTPVSDFDIQMSMIQTLKYPVSDSGQVIYDYYMVPSATFTCAPALIKDGSAKCGVNQGNSPLASYRTGVAFATCQDFCFYSVVQGKVGILQATPSTPTKIDIVVIGNGLTSQTVTLETDKQTTGNEDIIVNGKALGKVYYAGDLMNAGEYKPELFQLYKPVNVGGAWVFTSASAYNTYNVLSASNPSTVKANIDSCVVTAKKLGLSKSTAVSMMSGCVEKYRSAFVGLKPVSVSGLKEIKDNGVGMIYATFEADKLYSFPVLTFVLDTDWIGIRVLKGVPKVNSVSVTKDCTSGTHGEVTAVVSNTGGGVGAFDVTLACPSGVDVLTSVRTDNWQPAQSKDVKFEYDMNNIQTKTTKTCTVTAKDKGGSVYDQKSVSVSCNPTVICTAGISTCDGTTKKTCNELGSDFVLSTNDPSCQNDQKCVADADCGTTNGVINHCVNGMCQTGETCTGTFLVPASIGTKEECNFWCSIGLKKAEAVNVCVKDYTPLALGIFAVLVIFGVAVFSRNSGKKKGKGGSKGSSLGGGVYPLWKSKWFWIVLAILVGIAVVLSLLKYFVWGLVGFFALAIIIKWLFGVNLFKVIFKGG
jgi:hypothetical protein